MRVLLDENFPLRLVEDFVGHQCDHVIALGWEGTKNGELLAKAEQSSFDVLITYDADIPKEHDLTRRRLSVYVVKPQGQGRKATQPLIKEILVALESHVPGEVKTFTNRTGIKNKQN